MGYSGTMKGPRNEYGKWHGVVNRYSNSPPTAHEIVNMYNGKRHGLSIKTNLRTDEVSKTCYHMGERIPCEEKQQLTNPGASVYEVLEKRYPWFLFGWKALRLYENDKEGDAFTQDDIEAYIDALIEELAESEPEPWTFDLYFDNAQGDVLDMEEYQAIGNAQVFISMIHAQDHFKNYELRRAVVDQHRSDGESTFNIIKEDYPVYFDLLISGNFSEEDIMGFCNEVDDQIHSFEPLDQKDPLFLDSIDTRLRHVIYGLLSGDKSMSDLMVLAGKSPGNWSDLSRIWRHMVENAETKSDSYTPAQVAFAVLVDMDQKSKQIDPFRLAVRMAYFPDEVRLASLGTAFTGVIDGYMSLHCKIVSDGGGEITERGVVYGPTFEPNMSDHVIEHGSGTGAFFANIPIADPTETLFARAYAINSAGIAFSNQVEVVPDQTTSVVETHVPTLHVEAYPVPASSVLWVTTQGNISGETTLSLINTSGQVVYSQTAVETSAMHITQVDGGIRVSLNVEGLQTGVYFVRVVSGGETGVARVVIQ